MNHSNLHHRAMQLHHRGFTRAAIDILEVALRQAPDDGHTWQLRAVLLHDAGRYADALDNIERAQVLVVLHSRGRLVLADGLRHVGHRELAAETYRQLASDIDASDPVLRQVHRGLVALEKWRDAAGLCRRVLAHTPDDAELHIALAQALVHLNQPDEVVLSLIRRAVQLAPTTPAYRVMLATELLSQGLRREAYQQLCRLPPAALGQVCCRCCLRQFFELASDHGDTQRARWLAEELARPRRSDEQDHAGDER